MRLPSFVHDANVAGLEPKSVVRHAFIRLPSEDNAPSIDWLVDRLNALEGDLEAQTTLFESLPIDIQDKVWDRLTTKEI